MAREKSASHAKSAAKRKTSKGRPKTSQKKPDRGRMSTTEANEHIASLTPAQRHVIASIAQGLNAGEVNLSKVKHCVERMGVSRSRPTYLSPYLAFAQQKRNDVTGLSFEEQGKALGKMWKELNDAQKEVYRDKIPLGPRSTRSSKEKI